MRLTSKNKQKVNQSEVVTNSPHMHTHSVKLQQHTDTHTHNPSPKSKSESNKEYEELVTAVKSQTKPLRN